MGQNFLKMFNEWSINMVPQILVPQPTPSPPQPNSFVIEAENFENSFNIKTQDTQDTGGSKNVGWIFDGSWLTYDLSLTPRIYKVI